MCIYQENGYNSMITTESIANAIYIEWRVAHKCGTSWDNIFAMLDGMLSLILFSLPQEEYEPFIEDIRLLKAIAWIHYADL